MSKQGTLTELFRPPVGDPAVDVIAVHGLNGDAIKTWTSKNTGKSWLGDPDLLPSHLKQARILTYDYNADVTALVGHTSSNQILEHAHTMVAEIVADREFEDAVERPIIFICHSLGGIIVKRALAYSASRTSKQIQHLHSVFVSTFAVMFFGTPHNGSSKAQLASTGRRMIDALVPSKIWDTEGQLLDALKEGSETLKNITDLFVPLMKNFRIYFFWEQNKTDLGYKKDYVSTARLSPKLADSLCKIVEESSAAPILDNTERAGLPYNHSSMCKFDSKQAPGYRLVVAALKRYCSEAPQSIPTRWVNAKRMFQDLRTNEALDLLREL